MKCFNSNYAGWRISINYHNRRKATHTEKKRKEKKKMYICVQFNDNMNIRI